MRYDVRRRLASLRYLPRLESGARVQARSEPLPWNKKLRIALLTLAVFAALC